MRLAWLNIMAAAGGGATASSACASTNPADLFGLLINKYPRVKPVYAVRLSAYLSNVLSSFSIRLSVDLQGQ